MPTMDKTPEYCSHGLAWLHCHSPEQAQPQESELDRYKREEKARADEYARSIDLPEETAVEKELRRILGIRPLMKTQRMEQLEALLAAEYTRGAREELEYLQQLTDKERHDK
jgi:hypothetical protein